MRNTFLKTLVEEARKNKDIFLITPDLGYSVLEPFAQEFPERFINVGICEQNAIGVAAGLALNGKIPYVYSIIPFAVSRPYEQIKVDCAYMNTNVRIIGVGAGFSYASAGATHHSLDDLAIMRTLPNMIVVAPGSLNEAEDMVRYSVKHKGPIYMRLAKSGEPRFNYKTEIGKLSNVLDGTDFALIATSNMLEDAYNTALKYQKEGKYPILLSAHTLKPFDKETLLSLVRKNIPIITIEEHSIIGGLASAVSEVIAPSGLKARFLPIAVNDVFSHVIGSRKYIKEHLGIGSIKEKIDSFLRNL
jgi:transketolase